MIYANDDPMAISAMERDRTGNYGDCGYDEPRPCFFCGECGEAIFEDERYFNFEGNIICDSCIEHHECTAVWEGGI